MSLRPVLARARRVRRRQPKARGSLQDRLVLLQQRWCRNVPSALSCSVANLGRLTVPYDSAQTTREDGGSRGTINAALAIYVPGGEGSPLGDFRGARQGLDGRKVRSWPMLCWAA